MGCPPTLPGPWGPLTRRSSHTRCWHGRGLVGAALTHASMSLASYQGTSLQQPPKSVIMHPPASAVQPLFKGACTPGAQRCPHRPGWGFSFAHSDFSVPSLSLLSHSHPLLVAGPAPAILGGLRLFLQPAESILISSEASLCFLGAALLGLVFPGSSLLSLAKAWCCLCRCQPALPVPAGLSRVTSRRCRCCSTSFVSPGRSAVPTACRLGCRLHPLSQASAAPALRHR